jgi:hypothetical protein
MPPPSNPVELRSPGTYRSFLAIFVPLLIGVALANAIFYQVRLLAPNYVENKETFMSYSNGISGYQTMRKEWRTRFFSNWLAHYFVKAGKALSWDQESDEISIELAAGMWVASWYLLVAVLFVIVKRARSILYLFGIYAAISFGYMPGIVVRVYPWDMPPLFFFSAFVLLVDRRKMNWLIPLAMVGMGFKETTGVVCLAFLFLNASLRKRLIFLGVSLCACGTVKLLIDVATKSPHAVLTMTVDEWALTYNLKALLGIHRNTRVLRHPVLINAGTLVGFLLLPSSDREMRMLKTICIAFAVGTFLFGVIREYRIWFEMIPIALYGFELYFLKRSETPPKRSAVSYPT